MTKNVNDLVKELLNNSKSKEKEWPKKTLDKLQNFMNKKEDKLFCSKDFNDQKKDIFDKITDNLKKVEECMDEKVFPNSITIINCSVFNPIKNWILPLIDAITDGNCVLIKFDIREEYAEYKLIENLFEEHLDAVSRFVSSKFY